MICEGKLCRKRCCASDSRLYVNSYLVGECLVPCREYPETGCQQLVYRCAQRLLLEHRDPHKSGEALTGI